MDDAVPVGSKECTGKFLIEHLSKLATELQEIGALPQRCSIRGQGMKLASHLALPNQRTSCDCYQWSSPTFSGLSRRTHRILLLHHQQPSFGQHMAENRTTRGSQVRRPVHPSPQRRLRDWRQMGDPAGWTTPHENRNSQLHGRAGPTRESRDRHVDHHQHTPALHFQTTTRVQKASLRPHFLTSDQSQWTPLPKTPSRLAPQWASSTNTKVWPLCIPRVSCAVMAGAACDVAPRTRLRLTVVSWELRVRHITSHRLSPP